MLASYLFVMLGGALGSLLRFVTQAFCAVFLEGFPLGTMLVNFVGCFVIGLLFPLLGNLPTWLRPLVMTGFLGGLTTMSSYSLEVVTLLGQKRYAAAFLHWGGGAFVGMLFCYIGMSIGQKLSSVSS